MSNVRILYIAGLGHSGSTLLDLLISSHSRVISVGEIQVLRDPSNVQDRNRILEETRCPCGAENVISCSFWSEVEAILRRDHGLSLYTLDMNSKDVSTFVRHNRALFRSVSVVSGAAWIVDSSKNSDRLDRLLGVDGLDLDSVHLLRSPLGVSYSNRKKGRPVYHNALVYTHNFLYSAIVVQRMRYRVVMYEDIAETPDSTISGLMRWLGLEFEQNQLDWVRHPHHNIGGNRMRYNEESTIQADLSWKRNLSVIDRLGVTFVTVPTRIPRTLLYTVYQAAHGVRQFLRRGVAMIHNSDTSR